MHTDTHRQILCYLIFLFNYLERRIYWLSSIFRANFMNDSMSHHREIEIHFDGFGRVRSTTRCLIFSERMLIPMNSRNLKFSQK